MSGNVKFLGNRTLAALTVAVTFAVAAPSASYAGFGGGGGGGLGGALGGVGDAVGGIGGGVGGAVGGAVGSVTGSGGGTSVGVDATVGGVNASVNVGVGTGTQMSPTEARAIRATVRTINITALAEVGLTAPQREALATIGIDIGGIIDLSIQLGGNRPTRQNVLDALNSLPTRDRSTA
ncbi:MAG TPA: hypothetical protein VKN63_03310, partial [Afifellaceae bacterium]|nr:hypothetical protein [Afifellaceae bacterium]